MPFEDRLKTDAALAPLTTLALGGPARWLVEADSETMVEDAIAFARDRSTELVVLGGGSNVVVADAGVDALVVKMTQRGVERRREGDEVLVTAAAGEPWHDFVAAAVDEDLAGVECLGGIPGLVGATPIQNVGAYGQDVSNSLRSVRAFDRDRGAVVELSHADCEFGYRDSIFRRRVGRYIVLSVTYALRPGGAPMVRYGELERALGGPGASLSAVRETILRLRRGKSMVYDLSDPNHRSAGSFFTNVIVPDAQADEVVARALAAGIVEDASDVPRYAAGPGLSKLASGWLIERAGMAKGTRRGNVGISTAHALALVHHGGGSTAELLELARVVQATVMDRFGVSLRPEPVLLGFADPPL